MKKIIIGVLSVFTVVLILLCAFYFNNLKPVNSKNKDEIVFTIKSGESKVQIAKKLKNKKLVNNDKVAVVYMFLNNDLNLQAGTYSLNQSMDLKEILKKFDKGDIRVETINVTFVEGKRLTDYYAVLEEKFGFTEEEIKEVFENPDVLKEMVDKYWFLTDEILNDKLYFGLEGYIMPDTYEFMSNSGVKDVLIRLLDQTDKKLSAYKSQIESSKYSVHEILTMASIVELEANNKEDRQGVSQVIYKRLELNMSLGMDVTTYYAAKKKMGEELTMNELNSGNAYNTRNTNKLGLPVGPICNPSIMSIDAVFNPSKTNYVYFYADIATGKDYFAETWSEFIEIQRKVG